ncbi:DUF5127 domain-containing protein [Bacteroides thetaiotaomicron]|nr:hypothetical protein [Bacteroides thetaiotaomicron]MCS2998239.1 DUF5127 domain-containing protein [Bacteroides thetaiotaomicron]
MCRRGVLICANWGYAYLARYEWFMSKSVSLGGRLLWKQRIKFVRRNGTLATTKGKWTTHKEEDNPAMAYCSQSWFCL